MEHHQPVAGDQQERARRVVLEAHPSGPVQPGGPLADCPVWRRLEEVRLQRPEAVQVGLDSRQVGGVLRRRLEARLRPGGLRSESQRGEERQADQVTAVHAAHVAPVPPVCKCAAFRR